MCVDAYSACLPDRPVCSSFSVSARFGLLHELAHVWLLDHADGAIQDAFTEYVDLEVWNDGDRPWHERSVEHAAEMVAWGVMDIDLDLARIGSPDCVFAAEGFYVLTGVEPLRDCEGT